MICFYCSQASKKVVSLTLSLWKVLRKGLQHYQNSTISHTCGPFHFPCRHPQSGGCYGWHSTPDCLRWFGCNHEGSPLQAVSLLLARLHSTSMSACQAIKKGKAFFRLRNCDRQRALTEGITSFTHPDLVNNFTDLGFKPHIKHSVSLIQYKVSTSAKICLSWLQEIYQASRSSYTDLNTCKTKPKI